MSWRGPGRPVRAVCDLTYSSIEAGRLLRAGLPGSVAGGDAVRSLVRAGLQGVQAGRPVVRRSGRSAGKRTPHLGFRAKRLVRTTDIGPQSGRRPDSDLY